MTRQVLLAARGVKEQVVVTVGQGRIGVTVDGDADALDGARLLEALGSAPAWYRLYRSVAGVLARCPEVPVEDLETYLALTQRDRTVLAGALTGDSPAWEVWAACLDPAPVVRAAFSRHLPTGHRDLTAVALHLVEHEADDKVRLRVIGAMARVPAVLDAAVASPRATDRARAAASGQAQGAMARRLAADPDPTVRAALAHWTVLDESSVRGLAADPDVAVRVAVARYQSLTDEVAAARLLADAATEVVGWALRNRSVPETSWAPLMDHADYEVAKVAWSRAWDAHGDYRRQETYRPFVARWVEFKERHGVA